ncbi:MAG: phosphodiester glycosidase family protein [Acidobacteria bacterium]|nr:phosphodiester glycosidase family protein [Acidobacteriota bacterium]
MRKFATLAVLAILIGVGAYLYDARHVSVAALSPTSSTTTTTTMVTTTTVATPMSVCNVAARANSTCASWTARDVWAGGPASVYTTSFSPIASLPAIKAYASWIRTSTTDLALYPGYEGPGATTLPRGPEMVPPSATPRLLATFNSGFYEQDGPAGFYVNHTLYFPMIKGLATVVRYTNGTVDVMAWSGPARPGPDIVMARQNLPLLVDNAHAVPAVADNAAWGLTLHGAPAVWRTALGVDARGNLVYAAVSDVTAAQLAQTMLELHVVRAMELDINPEWPIFVTYASPGAKGPALDVPNPNQIPNRFLYSSTKDFFAVFTSTRPGEAQPW